MSAAALIALPERLSEAQKAALLKLLLDEDPAIYFAVRLKIISYGLQVLPWLEEFKLSNDPHLRKRSQEIVQHFAKQEADNRFLAFCLKHGEELDLEQGAWLLAKTQYPEISIPGYQALLDDFAGELQEQIDFSRDSKEVLSIVNDYLFRDLGFNGNEKTITTRRTAT